MITVFFKIFFRIIHTDLVNLSGLRIHPNRIQFIKSNQQYSLRIFIRKQYRNIGSADAYNGYNLLREGPKLTRRVNEKG